MDAYKSAAQIVNLATEIKNYHDSLVNELSEIDKKINDLNHVLEYVNLDAVGMIKVAKELRRSYNTRRDIKEQFHIASGIVSNIKIDNIRKLEVKSENRNYKYIKESNESYTKYILCKG